MNIEEFFAAATQLMHQKRLGYGSDNVTADSILHRFRDKLARLEHAHATSMGDSVYETCIDMANFAWIFLALHTGAWRETADRTTLQVVGDNFHKPQIQGDVGHDLSSDEFIEIAPKAVVSIHTGVRLLAPKGHWFSIRPRSSLSRKGIFVFDNVIDSEYTGELRVDCYNVSNCTVSIAKGDRIAQVIFFPAVCPTISHVESLPDTARGQRGYGSTGR